MKYLEPYAALTDATLAELASVGLLRRARKLSDDVDETDSDATGVSLRIAGHAVRVDARGPEAVSCACPTGGTCVHVVVACQWARARAAELGVRAAEPSATTSPRPTDPAPHAPDVPKTTDDTPATGTPDTPGAAGKPAPTGRPPAKRPARRPSAAQARRLAAARQRRAVALAEVRDAVVHLLDGGLAHLRHDTPESLRALAGRVRVAAFAPVHGLRLEALLRTAAGQSTALAGHDDGATEADLFATLTEIWALAEVHEAAEAHEAETADTDALSARPSTTAGGKGGSKGGPRSKGGGNGRDEDETDIARLVPLAARWWTGASGSRGLAFTAWDVEEERVRTAVTGRPAGTDPNFRRDWDARLLWNVSPSRLSAGPFEVSAVRARPDGTLGAGGAPRLAPLGEFGLDELRRIAEHTSAAVPARETVGFGRRPSSVRLLMVRDAGDIGVDEVRQDVTWTVVDSRGEPHLLRVPVEERHTADTLLHILAGRWSVVAVTVERHAGRLEPTGVFLRGHDGVIRLVSPSLIEQYQLGHDARRNFVHWDAWRKRISRVAGMRSRAQAVVTAPEPAPPVLRACDLAWDVTVAVAATGRHRLTARQRSDVEQARTLARDLGLATLERAIADLLPGDVTSGGADRPGGTGRSGGADRSADADGSDVGGPDAGSAAELARVSPEVLARAAFLIRRTREIVSASG